MGRAKWGRAKWVGPGPVHRHDRPGIRPDIGYTPNMDQGLLIILILVGWIVLQVWILPRMGVPT